MPRIKDNHALSAVTDDTSRLFLLAFYALALVLASACHQNPDVIEPGFDENGIRIDAGDGEGPLGCDKSFPLGAHIAYNSYLNDEVVTMRIDFTRAGNGPLRISDHYAEYYVCDDSLQCLCTNEWHRPDGLCQLEEVDDLALDQTIHIRTFDFVDEIAIPALMQSSVDIYGRRCIVDIESPKDTCQPFTKLAKGVYAPSSPSIDKAKIFTERQRVQSLFFAMAEDLRFAALDAVEDVSDDLPTNTILRSSKQLAWYLSHRNNLMSETPTQADCQPNPPATSAASVGSGGEENTATGAGATDEVNPYLNEDLALLTSYDQKIKSFEADIAAEFNPQVFESNQATQRNGFDGAKIIDFSSRIDATIMTPLGARGSSANKTVIAVWEHNPSSVEIGLRLAHKTLVNGRAVVVLYKSAPVQEGPFYAELGTDEINYLRFNVLGDKNFEALFDMEPDVFRSNSQKTGVYRIDVRDLVHLYESVFRLFSRRLIQWDGVLFHPDNQVPLIGYMDMGRFVPEYRIVDGNIFSGPINFNYPLFKATGYASMYSLQLLLPNSLKSSFPVGGLSLEDKAATGANWGDIIVNINRGSLSLVGAGLSAAELADFDDALSTTVKSNILISDLEAAFTIKDHASASNVNALYSLKAANPKVFHLTFREPDPSLSTYTLDGASDNSIAVVRLFTGPNPYQMPFQVSDALASNLSSVVSSNVDRLKDDIIDLKVKHFQGQIGRQSPCRWRTGLHSFCQ